MAAATPARLRRASFAWLVAALVAGAFVVDAYLRSWWETAYDIELATVAAVRRALPQLPRGAAVLADGACQEVGAGVAFHSPADLRSALVLAYGDTTLRADVVRPTLTVRRDGVHTKKWGEHVYPYARLVLLDVVSGAVERPADSASAESYFARHNPSREKGPCPTSPRAAPHALVAPPPPVAVQVGR